MNYSKYPKKLGEAVIHSTKRQHESNTFEITPHIYNTPPKDEKEELKRKAVLKNWGIEEIKISELEKGLFELQGAFPYMFDVINYACTHSKHTIQRIGNKEETHYQMKISVSDFYDVALDGLEQYKDNLEQELYKVMFNNPSKMLPETDTKSILTQPIRMSIKYADDTNGTTRNLKRTKGKTITGFIIEFYKPLWASLLEDDKAKAWFIIPKSFYAKMKDSISRCNQICLARDRQKKKDMKVALYIGPSTFPLHVPMYDIGYYKLFIYLSIHDNRSPNDMNDTVITIDAMDLIEHTCPSYLAKQPNGNYIVRNWLQVEDFLESGIRVFNQMAKEGLMFGIPLIPYSLEYKKPMQKIKIGIQRDTQKAIYDFTSNCGRKSIGYLLGESFKNYQQDV